MKAKYGVGAGVLMLMASGAMADVVVQFADGAPKDRFTITNTAACATGPISVTLDLVDAPAGLIFDITDSGAGVEVFQPLEIVSGAEFVQAVSEVADGDQSVTFNLEDIPQGGAVAFTVDLDDTTSDREITVNGSEMQGAVARITTQAGETVATFDDAGTAQVSMMACGA